MLSEVSFPQFTQLPVELQLQILGHYHDNSRRRYHYFQLDTFLPNSALGLYYEENWYHCTSLSTGQYIDNIATSEDEPAQAQADCIYVNDGLSSEKIGFYTPHRDYNITHAWANPAADIFSFRQVNIDFRQSGSFLGSLKFDPDIRRVDHWFSRVRKLALEVDEATVLSGHALTTFDEHMLDRAHALRIIYVVVDPRYRGLCDCEVEDPPTLVDSFVAPKDYLAEADTECETASLADSLHSLLHFATRVKGELDSVLRKRAGGRPVEVVTVFRNPDFETSSIL
ncbi:hypothetical protein PG995_000027 [Apiospora arundinis]